MRKSRENLQTTTVAMEGEGEEGKPLEFQAQEDQPTPHQVKTQLDLLKEGKDHMTVDQVLLTKYKICPCCNLITF
jgi:hypothetical protein